MDLISALSTEVAIATFIAFVISIVLWLYYTHKNKISMKTNTFYSLCIWIGSIISAYTLVFIVVPTLIYTICNEWVTWSVIDYMARLYTFIGALVLFVITLIGTARMKM